MLRDASCMLMLHAEAIDSTNQENQHFTAHPVPITHHGALQLGQLIHHQRIQCSGIEQMRSQLIYPCDSEEPHRGLNLVPHDCGVSNDFTIIIPFLLSLPTSSSSVHPPLG